MDAFLERLNQAIANVVRDLTPADLALHADGKWSAAQVLEHLYLTYTSTVKAFQRCLQAGQPLVTPATFRQRIAAAVTVGAGFMPGGRDAPRFTRPQGMPAESVVSQVKAQLGAMDESIAQCEERYGKRVKLVNHHTLGPLTGQQWRKFHWVHGNHHIKQIQRLHARRPV